jgi:hypothetical protein
MIVFTDKILGYGLFDDCYLKNTSSKTTIIILH